uniref:Transposase n=1 Tax=Cannabis sativa TaxID=3483 RepID=A0A803NSN3_CANSA
MYSSRHTTKEMIWHNTGRSKEVGVMHHPMDGSAWKEFDVSCPNFAREPRNVRLGLASNGINPFGNLSQLYSIWPVVLVNYNLPPMALPLVDELKELWSNGVQTRDGKTDTMFNMRAVLLWTVNDFSARSSLSGWSGQGYKACPTCNEDTSSIRVIQKTSYVGHRRFLPHNHEMRRDLDFDGKVEERHALRKFTCKQILEQVNALPPQILGKHESFGGLKPKRNASENIEKNVRDSLLDTVLDNEKSRDNVNATHDLKKMGIREWLWIYEDENKTIMKPHAP